MLVVKKYIDKLRIWWRIKDTQQWSLSRQNGWLRWVEVMRNWGYRPTDYPLSLNSLKLFILFFLL